MYILLMCGVTYSLPACGMAKFFLLGANLSIASGCGLMWRVARVSSMLLFPLALFMFPIHGTLYPENVTVLFNLHKIAVYYEGLAYSLNILLELSAILTSSLLFAFTTHPTDIINSLLQTGWPPSIAYLIGAPLFLLPAMRERIQTIQAAQRSRGLDSEASFGKRVRAIAPLVTPLVLSAFSEIEQRAIALELRGFTRLGTRVCMRTVPDSAWQYFLRWLMFFLFCVLCAYNLILEFI